VSDIDHKEVMLQIQENWLYTKLMVFRCKHKSSVQVLTVLCYRLYMLGWYGLWESFICCTVYSVMLAWLLLVHCKHEIHH
jgi:SNF family Na+-dependent transporter